jgi:hypothetical protein
VAATVQRAFKGEICLRCNQQIQLLQHQPAGRARRQVRPQIGCSSDDLAINGFYSIGAQRHAVATTKVSATAFSQPWLIRGALQRYTLRQGEHMQNLKI